VDPAAPTAEAYDNLRLICADVTQHLGAALAHAQQALEMAELDNPAGSAREWDDADVMQNLRSSASICGSKEHPAISLRAPGLAGVSEDIRTRQLLLRAGDATISLSAALRDLHGRDIPPDRVNGLRNALIDLRHSCDLILSHIQSTPSTKSTPSTTSTNP
jgi:hypothetical protein